MNDGVKRTKRTKRFGSVQLFDINDNLKSRFLLMLQIPMLLSLFYSFFIR